MLKKPTINYYQIKKLKIILKDRFPAVVEAFIQSVDEIIGHIQHSILTNDMASLAKAAHSLKSANQLGAGKLSELALIMEMDARKNMTLDLKDILEEIEEEFVLIKQEFGQMLVSVDSK